MIWNEDRLSQDERVMQSPASNRRLNLSGRKALTHVIVFGHGSEDRARMGDIRSGGIYPESLALPDSAYLLLTGCYQGKAELKENWSKGTGLDSERIMACSGETESALSTLFLLNLLEGGSTEILYWFRRWIAANEYFFPVFQEARKIYKQNQDDFVYTLKVMSEMVDITPFADFFSPAPKYAGLLENL